MEKCIIDSALHRLKLNLKLELLSHIYKWLMLHSAAKLKSSCNSHINYMSSVKNKESKFLLHTARLLHIRTSIHFKFLKSTLINIKLINKSAFFKFVLQHHNYNRRLHLEVHGSNVTNWIHFLIQFYKWMNEWMNSIGGDNELKRHTSFHRR